MWHGMTHFENSMRFAIFAENMKMSDIPRSEPWIHRKEYIPDVGRMNFRQVSMDYDMSDLMLGSMIKWKIKLRSHSKIISVSVFRHAILFLM